MQAIVQQVQYRNGFFTLSNCFRYAPLYFLSLHVDVSDSAQQDRPLAIVRHIFYISAISHSSFIILKFNFYMKTGEIETPLEKTYLRINWLCQLSRKPITSYTKTAEE